MKEHVLITGWSGFIGSHLLEAFQTDEGRSVKLFSGDIKDEANVVRNLRGIDTVIHAAALTYVPSSWDSPDAYYQTNTLGTVNLLKNHGMFKRFIYFSTSHVYGSQTEFPLGVDTKPIPADPYAASKLAAEDAVRLYGRRYGFDYLIVRPFNNFGPRQSSHFLIPTMVRQYVKTGRITLRGNTRRDFIYVKDTARAVRLLYENETTGLVLICSGTNYALDEIATMITGDPKAVSISKTDREGWDIAELLGDPSSLESALPSFRMTPIEEALKETVEAYSG